MAADPTDPSDTTNNLIPGSVDHSAFGAENRSTFGDYGGELYRSLAPVPVIRAGDTFDFLGVMGMDMSTYPKDHPVVLAQDDPTSPFYVNFSGFALAASIQLMGNAGVRVNLQADWLEFPDDPGSNVPNGYRLQATKEVTRLWAPGPAFLDLSVTDDDGRVMAVPRMELLITRRR